MDEVNGLRVGDRVQLLMPDEVAADHTGIVGSINARFGVVVRWDEGKGPSHSPTSYWAPQSLKRIRTQREVELEGQVAELKVMVDGFNRASWTHASKIQELDDARETNRKLNRRAQEGEAALAELRALKERYTAATKETRDYYTSSLRRAHAEADTLTKLIIAELSSVGLSRYITLDQGVRALIAHVREANRERDLHKGITRILLKHYKPKHSLADRFAALFGGEL